MPNVTPELPRTEIRELFDSFGLRPDEQRAYLFLLEHGASSVSPVARGLGKPVSTTQAILARLLLSGVVDVSLRGTRKIFAAAEPERFRHLAERQVQDAVQLARLLAPVHRKADLMNARVRVFPLERMADVFHLVFKCKQKQVSEIVSARDLQELLGARFHFTNRRVKSGIRLRSLRVEATEIKRYNKISNAHELREARFLPVGTLFRSSLAFFDDTVIFYPAKQEGFALVVESRSLREMIEQVFEILWSMGRRMETA